MGIQKDCEAIQAIRRIFAQQQKHTPAKAKLSGGPIASAMGLLGIEKS